jgi:hypothetical protein
MQNLPIDTKITYKNGGLQTQAGTIKKAMDSRGYYLVINHDNAAQVELYNAGFAVGDGIHYTQIISKE